MKRRSFLGLFLAAPFAAPAAVKAAVAAEAAVAPQVLNVAGLSAIQANLGTYTTGLFASPDASFTIDLSRGMITLDESLGIGGSIVPRQPPDDQEVSDYEADMDVTINNYSGAQPTVSRSANGDVTITLAAVDSAVV